MPPKSEKSDYDRLSFLLPIFVSHRLTSSLQGWTSIGSRRNFSSLHGSNGETESLYEALKSLYKNPHSKKSIELKEKLKDRGIAVYLTGYFLGFVTIKKPSWEMARALEKERRVFERRQSSNEMS